MPLPFPSEVELGSWSAFPDGLNLSFFFFFLWLPIFIKGSDTEGNYSSLCSTAVCIATLHKEVILDFKTLKIYRSEIQPSDHTPKAI